VGGLTFAGGGVGLFGSVDPRGGSGADAMMRRDGDRSVGLTFMIRSAQEKTPVGADRGRCSSLVILQLRHQVFLAPGIGGAGGASSAAGAGGATVCDAGAT
jgi:hypothetical protein